MRELAIPLLFILLAGCALAPSANTAPAPSAVVPTASVSTAAVPSSPLPPSTVSTAAVPSADVSAPLPPTSPVSPNAGNANTSPPADNPPAAGTRITGTTQTITMPAGSSDWNDINPKDTRHWFHVVVSGGTDLNALSARINALQNVTIYPVLRRDKSAYTVSLTRAAQFDAAGDYLLLQDLGPNPTANPGYYEALSVLQNMSNGAS